MTESYRLKEKGSYVPAFVATVLLILFFEYFGIFDGPNRHVYDLFFRLRGSREPFRSVVIASIDEGTLTALGRWPIARKYYADLLERLKFADAVSFDVVMAESSDQDGELAAAIRNHGRVVLSAYLDSDGNLVYPSPSLGSPACGHIHIELGTDGIAREIFNTISSRGASLQSLAAVTYEAVAHRPLPRPEGGKELCTAAIIQSDSITINFYGHAGTFQHISFLDILQGRFPPEFFKGKTVLVGITAAGIEGGLLTPFSANRNTMPGVEFHANVFNNMLDGSFIRPMEDWPLRSLAVLIAFCSFLLFSRCQAMPAFLLWACGMLVSTVAVFTLLARLCVWVPPVGIWASLTLPFLAYCVLELRQMYRSLVHAKKEWEESFNTIDDAIVVQNRNGTVVRVNHAALDMLGEFLEGALKRRCAELSFQAGGGPGGSATPDEPDDAPKKMEELFDAATGRCFEIKSLPRQDPENRFLGAVHVVRDITLAKKAQKEQQELQTMLIQAQKMEALGSLAGGIAHDFNNILAAIVGNTELVFYSLTPHDTESRQSLEQVLTASERARELIAQILAFSRKTVPTRNPVRVSPVVADALKLFRSGIPRTVEVLEDLCEVCQAAIDSTHMHQVVLNLCTNAYHAMKEKGAGTIEVTLEQVLLESTLREFGQQLPPGSYLRLTVRDTGHGIPEEHREKIFEPYFTTKAVGEGTGLGLAIVLKISRQYGGFVTFESKPGVGTAFQVYLPRVPAPAGE